MRSNAVGGILEQVMKRYRAVVSDHRKEILVNLPAAIAYLLSIVSFVLLFAFVFDVMSPPATPIKEVVVSGGANGLNEVSVSQQVATYVLASFMLAISVALMVTLPYYLARTYARGVRRLMRLLRLPQTSQQLMLLKLMIFSVPLVGFTVAILVVPQVTYTLAALTVVNLMCCVAAILLTIFHAYIVYRHKLVVSRVW